MSDELKLMLRRRLGLRGYLFWAVATRAMPTRLVLWLLNRVPDEPQNEQEEEEQ